MLRAGEGAGITGVILNRTSVDLFNPKTIRSTMGSIYRVPYFISEDLPQTLSYLKKEGVTLFAAHLRGERAYDRADYTGATGFLIGNEANGLSDELAGLADSSVRIPMEGHVESLNAAVSATLFMYECSRQRRNRNESLV
jgi:TrmH family RNA methyltransferase